MLNLELLSIFKFVIITVVIGLQSIMSNIFNILTHTSIDLDRSHQVLSRVLVPNGSASTLDPSC